MSFMLSDVEGDLVTIGNEVAGLRLIGAVVTLGHLLGAVVEDLEADAGVIGALFEVSVLNHNAAAGAIVVVQIAAESRVDEVCHIVVCLFVVVDIANIQLFFTSPNIHAKIIRFYARK